MKKIKNNRKSGITLVALSIYIVTMVIVVALISLLTTFFYGNVLNMSDTTKDLAEFDQFNAYMVEETQKVGNRISNLNEENKTVAFTSGNVYTMEESGIYCNDVRVYQANLDLANSYFSIKQENGKDILVISVLTDTSYTRTEEYVIDPTGVAIYETGENYTGQELKAVIPEGYVASSVSGENTVADGLVIYEGTEPVTDENHAEALKTRNQYVWIPVPDINSMVMCSSNTGDSVCNLVLVGDTLKCTVHTDTATDLVGRLYTTTHTGITEGDNTIYTYEMDFTRRDQIYSSNGYREPDVVTGNYTGDGTDYDGDSSNLEAAGMPAGSTVEQFLRQLKSDFTMMATSVAKNGGFYISRYEIGLNGESKKDQTILVASNANMWYGLYQTIRDISNNQQMIWGCQYDQVIKFIGEEANIGHTDRNLTTTPTSSGQNNLVKMKNIYDLEGNFCEWTLEACYENSRAGRGGSFQNTNSKDFYSASYHFSSYPIQQHNVVSSRAILYI